jgi:large subunit ribosomal protein L15
MANVLSNLHPPVGAVRNKTRKGRGVGSGLGKTAGKGQKGQKARHAGNFSKMAFQGGQTPIQRRLPKRGFRVPFPTETIGVNVSSLEKRFPAGSVVDFDALVKSGLVDKGATRVKVLGDGELTVKLSLKVHAISAGARAKVEAVGGTVELLGGPEA